MSVICSPRSYKELSQLRSTGNSAWPGRPTSLDRVPLYPTQSVPNSYAYCATTDATYCFTGDFSKLILGFRMNPRIEVLKERFASDFQYGFLGVMRLDIGWEHDNDFCTIVGVKATT